MDVLHDSDKEDEISRNLNVNNGLDKITQDILDVFEDSDDDQNSYKSEDLEQDEITRDILEVFENSEDSDEEVVDHCGQEDILHDFHMVDKNWICPICGNLYAAMQNLKLHVRSVHQKETETCNICGKVNENFMFSYFTLQALYF